MHIYTQKEKLLFREKLAVRNFFFIFSLVLYPSLVTGYFFYIDWRKKNYSGLKGLKEMLQIDLLQEG